MGAKKRLSTITPGVPTNPDEVKGTLGTSTSLPRGRSQMSYQQALEAAASTHKQWCISNLFFRGEGLPLTWERLEYLCHILEERGPGSEAAGILQDLLECIPYDPTVWQKQRHLVPLPGFLLPNGKTPCYELRLDTRFLEDFQSEARAAHLAKVAEQQARYQEYRRKHLPHYDQQGSPVEEEM